MTKGETIAYAINKECSSYSLVDWCENWGISVDEFKRFLEYGKINFDIESLYDEIISDEKSD